MTPTTATSLLGETLLAEILSFSDAPDLLHVLESRHPILLKAARLALSNTTALHFSYLLQLDRCRNHGSAGKKNTRRDQEGCIRQLLDVLLVTRQRHSSSSKRCQHAKLQRIEFTGLRHVVGDQGDWMRQLFQGPLLATTLTSIDFTGCGMLDPRLLHQALVPSSTSSDSTTTSSSSSLRHLTFQGCYRVDEAIVLAIANAPRYSDLQTLGLGGCSQSIGDDCVYAIMKHLRQLKYLDLSGLKRITERASQWLLCAPTTLESLELAGCELLRFSSLLEWGRAFRQAVVDEQGDTATTSTRTTNIDPTPVSFDSWLALFPEGRLPPECKQPLHNLTRINLNGIGTPRRGLVQGALPYFACRSMGNLREVYLSGCEHIRDWEVQVLAMVCANSLTCLEMRACCIGDAAVRAVGFHCTQLADVDFSACFQITDEGILAFCQYQGIWEDVYHIYPGSSQFEGNDAKLKQRIRSSTIRSLKIAALPQLTNESVAAIAALESLIVLDVNNCPKIIPEVLAETTKHLTSLVEVDAKGIGKWSSSVAALYSYDEEEPRHLRFVNGRPFQNKCTAIHTRKEGDTFNCCIVRQYSKRFNQTQGVPLQPMYHCLDCKLIPSLNRGMCHACAVHCHQGHEIIVGSYTRFYCDCPFGTVGTQANCQAISCDGAKEQSTGMVDDCPDNSY